MIKQMFGAAAAITLIAYVGYIIVPSDQCERIEHSSQPAVVIAKTANFLLDPWTDNAETKLTVKVWGLKFRLGWVQFVQQQFFSKDNIKCAWTNEKINGPAGLLDALPVPGGSYSPANLPAPQKSL